MKLPSGSKKIVPSGCMAMIGQVAGGGRTEKPMLNAGNTYHKFFLGSNKVMQVALGRDEFRSGIYKSPSQVPIIDGIYLEAYLPPKKIPFLSNLNIFFLGKLLQRERYSQSTRNKPSHDHSETELSNAHGEVIEQGFKLKWLKLPG
ncbi:predicted protein [Arabidopsis lyrata subsp. lyrata]|uniref:Predicted protein n=1 Tax=Arabidopsis lyrata subsp. lyrata TaxID=81972 RepID=D7M2N3_ARALL|nr:predicted protein [Arabidopsis lyrata subsp. lyrata]